MRAGLAACILQWGALTEFLENVAMGRVRQTLKQKRITNPAALTALGAAGVGLSLVGGASASTTPTAAAPQPDSTSPNQRFVLGDEEIADVSLATFHHFDKENVGGVQLAVIVRGCGGCRGCRGCGGWRGCRCAGCGGCGGCCRSWGRCRWC